MAERRSSSAPPAERAALVGLVTGSSRRVEADQSLDELAALADAAGATVVVRTLQDRQKPDPATYIGSGKVASLKAACAEADVDVVISVPSCVNGYGDFAPGVHLPHWTW